MICWSKDTWMASRETCISLFCSTWRAVLEMFVTLLRINASERLEKKLSKSYLQKRKMEKWRERALHNLRMPKNISDTLACGSCATSLI